jgi:hypothetical protein
MHLIIPFAASLSEPCLQALPQLQTATGALLPQLQALLDRLQADSPLEGDEYALSMPHERVLAQAMGWPVDLADGTLPWAGWWAAQDDLDLPPGETWALLSPGHWLMGRDHLTLIDPDQLQLSEAESRALFDTVLPFFESDGWALRYGAPTRWYATHASLSGLPTASLDRVIGRNPDVWLTDHPQARVLRRLQSEAQMLWYQHPLHDERQERGLLPVNSFWVSGCGVVQRPAPAADMALRLDLRVPMLADDMAAWLDAWRALDQGPVAQALQALEAGQPVQLTLCGERHARTWRSALPGEGSRSSGLKGLWQRLTQASRPTASLTDTLAGL